ncbi:DNA-binding transcriptional LysR family regulator [Branchiibius hedensis]|uniref:DNA-binding transcriptional regulator, LysR family n=1 Tax=Branchiibius hedensis TaxID=672460 RepID=A0A2Y9BUR5_9MICO|nr:LysR family transcriptional regulator [Branchiibius hedensis]PWJ27351.1 DNA-binding transcriptional LysR family regulator [Branchiibius hedensis]SSA36162.1 DNA-binding transcriptional regulator, LysR family [Branchiibius hedensis]
MDTRHLEFFVAVAEELNFTRAAARVQAAQSTVSAGIAALERQLGGALFERSTRTVTLTPLGEQSVPIAREVMLGVRRLGEQGAQTKAGVRGRVRFGVMTNLAWLQLPSAIARFQQENPMVDVQMSVSPRGSTGLAADMRRGRLDIALVGLRRDLLSGLDVVRLTRQPYVAVLPLTHPLARRRSLEITDLIGDPFIDLPRGFGTRDQLDAMVNLAGGQRRVSVEVPDLGTVPAFVRAGLGVAVVPVPVADGAGLVTIPMRAVPPWELLLVTRPGESSPAVDVFAGLLRDWTRARSRAVEEFTRNSPTPQG